MAPLALEDGVLAHAHLDVQVARSGRRCARLALAAQADAVAAVDPGGTFTGALLLAHAALAEAGVAGIADDVARPRQRGQVCWM